MTKIAKILMIVVLILAVATPTFAAPLQQEESCDFFCWVFQQFQNFGNFIAQVFQNVINFIGDVVGGYINWQIENIKIGWERFLSVFNFLFGLLQTYWNFILSIIAFIIELIEIAILIVQIIVGLGWLLISYIAEAISILLGITDIFATATPTPLPGMPLCVSAPTSYELCAVWYFLENTLLTGSNGDIIITVAIVIIDVQIVFYVIRQILKIVRKGEEITNVG